MRAFLQTPFRGFSKVYLPFKKENANKINKLPLKEYLEDFMKRRQQITAKTLASKNSDRKGKTGKLAPKPINDLGYINLPQNNFDAMIDRIQTKEDVEVLKEAYVQFLGHRNLISQSIIDKLLLKALEIGQPEQMIEFVKYHSELLYHPQPKVTQAYTTYFQQKGYDSLKVWFGSGMKGRYLMLKPNGFHQLIIDEAFTAGDKSTVIDAYLDVLDYDKDLEDSAFVKVLESTSFKEAIDHVLFGHVKEHMDKRVLDSRLQMSAYYINIQGGLTASDLINEIANDSKVERVPNSNLFKDEVIAKVLSDSVPLDSFVRDKLKEAITALLPKLDVQWYGLESLIEVKETPVIPEQQQSQAETTV